MPMAGAEPIGAIRMFQDAEMEAATIRHAEGKGLAFISDLSKQSCFGHSVDQ